jgi:hypothetical protein
MSWKMEVSTDSSGKWYPNACRYGSEVEALAAGEELMSRWLLVRDYRATETPDEPVNYIFNAKLGKPQSLEQAEIETQRSTR